MLNSGLDDRWMIGPLTQVRVMCIIVKTLLVNNYRTYMSRIGWRVHHMCPWHLCKSLYHNFPSTPPSSMPPPQKKNHNANAMDWFGVC